MTPLHVVYIASCARSGSTILDIVLGNHPKIESVGELKEFARLQWPENGYCSCRQRVHQCPHWSSIHEEWLAHVEDRDLTSYIDWLGFFLSLKSWPRWRRAVVTSSSGFRLFQAQTLALYRAIQKVSGKNVIVDSSKGPGLVYLLSTLPEIKLSVIHLVRDGRGVAWSFLKAFRKNERAGLERDLVPTPPWKVAARWRAVNSLTGWALRKGGNPPSMRVRYEDFAADPAKELATIGRFLDTDFAALSARAAAGDAMEIGHKVGGSRIRMQNTIHLEAPDDAWRESLPASARLQVRLLAGRQLTEYGYGASKGEGTPRRSL